MTTPQRAQSGIEFLNAFEQVERECGAGNIDPKVALQVQRDARAPQAAGGETPVAPASAAGLENALQVSFYSPWYVTAFLYPSTIRLQGVLY